MNETPTKKPVEDCHTLHDLSSERISAYSQLGHIRKEKYHRAATKQLHKLAKALGLARDDYDLRTNKGGIAVCGEITLHTDTFYCEVSQSSMGIGSEIMFRRCDGRKDYTGGPNNFAPAAVLDDAEEFAQYIRKSNRFGF